jgi:hypothetical protein
MRTVKVRILPPQPNFPSRIDANLGSVKSNTDINTRKSRKFPFDTVSMKKGDFMGRRAEVVLYRIYIVDGRHRYVRIVRSGRSWTPKTQPPGQPAAYYLRYRKNGRRTFESVGGDLSVALQEREARAKTLVGSGLLVNRPESQRYG